MVRSRGFPLLTNEGARGRLLLIQHFNRRSEREQRKTLAVLATIEAAVKRRLTTAP
jgi:hypothetical protein